MNCVGTKSRWDVSLLCPPSGDRRARGWKCGATEFLQRVKWLPPEFQSFRLTRRRGVSHIWPRHGGARGIWYIRDGDGRRNVPPATLTIPLLNLAHILTSRNVILPVMLILQRRPIFNHFHHTSTCHTDEIYVLLRFGFIDFYQAHPFLAV